MNIVFSVDNNFVKQLSVTIASILLNSDIDDKFNFYVLDGGISDESKLEISKLRSIKYFSIEYLEIRSEDFQKCPVFAHFTQATYYRFKLPSLIQEDRVLYMDCDILVNNSLKGLYDIEFDDRYAVVVEDLAVENKKVLLKKLNVKNYFNAGIMLLNLEKLRQDNIEEKCFDFVEKYPEKITWVDQCVLNAVFKNNVKFVDVKYNFIYLPWLKIDKEKIVVLHFAGDRKPWGYGNNHEFKREYYFYLLKTPYRKEIFSMALKEIDFLTVDFRKKLKLTSESFIWALTD